MQKIEMTIEELQAMLDEQKRVVGEYITRNLSGYHWWGKDGVNTVQTKDELKILKARLKNLLCF